MEFENSQNNALAKLPMLKLGEYEMWEIRIKQNFQIQDYALWEMTVPSTTEEKICKKNDVKARSLLLMALPNEHQLTFNQYVDAQSMFVAIKARFGGNEATKRTQKALLKQQYENFNASSSESLDSIFNRLQKLVSRLAILGVVTPPEDLNVKFLRSLPSEWDTHVVVWMNKPDFDTMGLDDLYNNFKIVEQKVKKSTADNNDDKNLAFLTTSSPSSTNTINTVNTGVSTGTNNVNTASTETSTASFSDATVYAFLSTQPQGSQLVHEDLEQLHDDDLEEMDLKWNMALLSMRARKFYQRTGRKIIIDGSSTAGFDKSKVECFNCHKMGHFARECRAPRSKDNRNWNQGSSSKAVRIEDASEKAMCAIDGAGFDWSDMAEDEIQANMALMAFTDSERSAILEAQVSYYKEAEVLFSEGEGKLLVEKKCRESDNSKENTDDSLTQQPKTVTETSSVMSPLKVKIRSRRGINTSHLDNHYCDEKGNYGPKFTEGYGASHIKNAIPRKDKDSGSFTLPCFINDFCFDNALVRIKELATVKYPKGIAENVLVGISKFTFLIDFIILDMPEDVKVPLILRRPFLSTARAKIDVYKRKITLRVGEEKIIFKSVKPAHNPFLKDYIELNDLNEPFELRRNQGDDLMPTIEEGALMNVPIFVGTFSIMIDLAVLEDMDAYRDNEMGDVIFGEPFLREVRIKTQRFEGIITLYNGDDEVTYQVVQSHPRFKRHTNKQCNKIPPLLKVSEKDEKNGISHAYQKLKGFYKGDLNLGPDYIRDAKMEEWLTRGHINVHKLE
ncbi:ribonuclease H-like domain-containing protein [Tanacetum coccineum]